MSIRIRRVYDPPVAAEGHRILVDRLWPRGLSKAAAGIDLWLKEIAPSNELRRWYQHDETKWPEFRRRYFAELDQQPDVVECLRQWIQQGDVVLLFGARETRYNNAAALKDYLAGR